MPQAQNARPILAEGLRQAGWDTWPLVAYRGVMEMDAPIPDWSGVDAITLASSATVERLLQRCEPQDIAHCHLIAMGPRTADTIKKHGLPVAAVAEQPTIPDLVRAVLQARNT